MEEKEIQNGQDVQTAEKEIQNGQTEEQEIQNGQDVQDVQTAEQENGQTDIDTLFQHIEDLQEAHNSLNDTITLLKEKSEQTDALIEKMLNDSNEFAKSVNSKIAEAIESTQAVINSFDSKIEEAILLKLPPIEIPQSPKTPNSDLTEFLSWANKREELQPQDPSFYVYEESYIKALAMIEPLKNYIDNRLYPQVLFSLTLHYIIVEDYEYQDDNGFTLKNPLYKKYNIASKSFIVSSASDESSSSSIHATKSLNEGDFTMQDLIRTKYGTYVYQILEQLDVGAVLL